MDNEIDIHFMQRALTLAERAAEQGEVPVGAVLVLNQAVIGEGYNQPIGRCDPAAHAEMMAMRDGATKLDNYRLVGTTLYVTLEPCLMCAGAMVHARVKRLVYGAADPKAGVITSQMKMFESPFLNHRVLFEGGLMSDQCGLLLTDFFRRKR